MDLELARTFLAVRDAGNFVAAADRLHVTQSTVSTRIASLESILGARLFERGRGGARLTGAGHRFSRHAKMLMRTMEQARHEVGLPAGYEGSLTLGGRIAVWEGFLPQWVHWLREQVPRVSVRMEIGFEQDLMDSLIQGNMDIAVMYTPQHRPGLRVEHLFDESLVLVTSDLDVLWPDPGYVYIDWGPEFHAQHREAYPDMEQPGLVANIGWLGIGHILAYGGSGYFPSRITQDLVATGRLQRVPGSPVFRLPTYAVYHTVDAEPYFHTALEGLRRFAQGEREKAPAEGA